uniref:Uncharacterized protein n=1 Tax=Caldisericum exile TaxID=693075 RepID=A0A7C4Y3F2_9BACT
MKKILLLVLVLFPSVAFASPFLVCDPYPSTQTQPDYFIIVLDGKTYSSSAFSNPDGSKQLKFDVGFVSSGSHSLTVKACKEDANGIPWCSDEVPFAFERPSAVAPPGGLKLSK